MAKVNEPRTFYHCFVGEYEIMARIDGMMLKVVTPEGKTISCLKTGTHVALSRLPREVRAEAERMAGWK